MTSDLFTLTEIIRLGSNLYMGQNTDGSSGFPDFARLSPQEQEMVRATFRTVSAPDQAIHTLRAMANSFEALFAAVITKSASNVPTGGDSGRLSELQGLTNQGLLLFIGNNRIVRHGVDTLPANERLKILSSLDGIHSPQQAIRSLRVMTDGLEGLFAFVKAEQDLKVRENSIDATIAYIQRRTPPQGWPDAGEESQMREVLRDTFASAR